MLLKAGLARTAQPWARRAVRCVQGSSATLKQPAALRLDPWTDPHAVHPLPGALQPRNTTLPSWSPGTLGGPALDSGPGLGSVLSAPLRAPDPKGHRGRRHGSSDAGELLVGKAPPGGALLQSRQMPIRARRGAFACGDDEAADTASAPARLRVLAPDGDAGAMPCTTAPIACTRPGARPHIAQLHIPIAVSRLRTAA